PVERLAQPLAESRQGDGTPLGPEPEQEREGNDEAGHNQLAVQDGSINAPDELQAVRVADVAQREGSDDSQAEQREKHPAEAAQQCRPVALAEPGPQGGPVQENDPGEGHGDLSAAQQQAKDQQFQPGSHGSLSLPRRELVLDGKASPAGGLRFLDA